MFIAGHKDKESRSGRMMARKTALLLVVAITGLVFGASFSYGVFSRSGWPSQVLGGTPVEDGFYHLDWNSRDELQLVFIGECFGHYALIYGQNIGGDWSLTYISRLFSEHEGASLALDSKDNVYVCTHSYDGVDYTTLRPHVLFAANAGGEWADEVVNVTGHCSAAEVVVDSNDDVHVLYSRDTHQQEENPNSSIVDMKLTRDGWMSTTLKASYTPYVFYQIEDVDRRADGSIGMIYRTYNLLSWDVIAWSRMNYSVVSDGELISDTTIIPSLSGYRGVRSLCHDSEGNAYVSAYSGGDNAYSVCYLTNAGGDWTCADVAYAGNSPWGYGTGTDIKVGQDGSIYIGYFAQSYDGETTNHTVRYCTNENGEWRAHVLDDCHGWFTKESIALTIDQCRDIHVIYYGEMSAIYTTSQLDSDRYTLAAFDSAILTLPFVLATVAILVFIALRETRRKKRKKEREELGDRTGLYEHR